jgi:hypothetical protein
VATRRVYRYDPLTARYQIPYPFSVCLIMASTSSKIGKHFEKEIRLVKILLVMLESETALPAVTPTASLDVAAECRV